jgi:hypothetical protein
MLSKWNERATGNRWPDGPARGNALLAFAFFLLMAALVLVVAVFRWLI